MQLINTKHISSTELMKFQKKIDNIVVLMLKFVNFEIFI